MGRSMCQTVSKWRTDGWT